MYEETQELYLEALEWWDKLPAIEKIGVKKIIIDAQSKQGES